MELPKNTANISQRSGRLVIYPALATSYCLFSLSLKGFEPGCSIDKRLDNLSNVVLGPGKNPLDSWFRLKIDKTYFYCDASLRIREIHY